MCLETDSLSANKFASDSLYIEFLQIALVLQTRLQTISGLARNPISRLETVWNEFGRVSCQSGFHQCSP